MKAVFMIIMILAATAAPGPYCQAGFNRVLNVGNVSLYWVIDYTTGIMKYGAVVPMVQWFAFGVYPYYASNITADLFTFSIVSNQILLQDQYINSTGSWIVDSVQKFNLTGATITSNSISVNFQRLLNTNDWQDVLITDSVPYTMFFYTSPGNVTSFTNAAQFNQSTPNAQVYNSSNITCSSVGSIIILGLIGTLIL